MSGDASTVETDVSPIVTLSPAPGRSVTYTAPRFLTLHCSKRSVFRVLNLPITQQDPASKRRYVQYPVQKLFDENSATGSAAAGDVSTLIQPSTWERSFSNPLDCAATNGIAFVAHRYPAKRRIAEPTYLDADPKRVWASGSSAIKRPAITVAKSRTANA